MFESSLIINLYISKKSFPKIGKVDNIYGHLN